MLDSYLWINFILAGMRTRFNDLLRFYALMEALEERIGGMRQLSMSDGRMEWPRRGVYFFTEKGEQRSDTGAGPRIVRVGTHALKDGSRTTLWNRLSQHRGSARSGAGNHRGSIFRLIVGTALIKKGGHKCLSWDDRKSSAPREVRMGEQNIERFVSAEIGAMPFLWLDVDDVPSNRSARGIIERGAIALLSNFEKEPIDPASGDWLGRQCNRPRVRASGLWNNNHVDEVYDPSFLDELERHVERARQ